MPDHSFLMMRPGRSLLAVSLVLIGGLNERVAELFRPVPHDFCETSCKKGECFVTETLDDIPVSGWFKIYVQATQSIVEEEVKGSGYRAFLVRRLGRNKVPAYPAFPDPGKLDRSDEFKTTNAVLLTGRVANGRMVLDLGPPDPVYARIGVTDLQVIGIAGKTFVNDKLAVTSNQVEHCILGAIARPLAIANLGRRIVIGSRIRFKVRVTGWSTAMITPSVTYSRFPTTFIWVQRESMHERPAPLYEVLEHCEGWIP